MEEIEIERTFGLKSFMSIIQKFYHGNFIIETIGSRY